MKTTTKSLLVGGLLGVLGLGTLGTVGIASAESTDASDNPMSSLVDKLATTFNLDKSKVQQVFDEEHTAHEAEREQQQAEKLQKLVDDGTITSTQKTAIETKIKELKAEREANKDTMKNLSDDERKAKMDAERTALQTWATSQGLDLSKLHGILMGGPGGHGGQPPAN